MIINREKSVMFLYTNNKLSEKERNQSHLQEHQKKILRNKFNSAGENLYSENYERLIKEIKEEANQWEGTSCLNH